MAHEINNLTGNIHFVGPHGFPQGLSYRSEDLPVAVIENLKTAVNIFYREVDEIPLPTPDPGTEQGTENGKTILPPELDLMPIERLNALKASEAVQEIQDSDDTEFLQVVSLHAEFKTVRDAAAKRLSLLAQLAAEEEQKTSVEQADGKGDDASKELDPQ